MNIAAANAAYLASVNRELSDIIGRWAWDAFPTDEDTLRQAIHSFELVKQTRRSDTMALLRFDVPAVDGQSGKFEKRYWSITHTPVLDDAGEVEFILQHPIDVTALEILRQTIEASGGETDLKREHSGIFDRANAVYRANQKLTAEAERSAAAIATLSAERETLAGLFEQAPSFMALLLGREHRVEFANPGYLALIGKRPIIGRTIAEALGDAVEQGYVELLDQVLDDGMPYQANGARYGVQLMAGGSVDERFVDFVLQPFRGPDGQVVGICVQGVDVTSRVREDRFRTALERLTKLVTRIEDPVDLAFEAGALVGEVLGASRVGYSRIEHDEGMLVTERDWTAQGVVSLAGRLQLGKFGTFIEDMRRGEVIAIADVRLDPRSSDAAGLEERHARAFLNIPVIERGQLVAAFFVNMADVYEWSAPVIAFIREAAERVRTATERLQSDLARQRATDQIRTLNATLEHRVAALAAERDQLWRVSRDPFVVCDLEGRWISASPVWTEILGWRLEELIGRTSSWMEHPDDVSRTKQKVVDVADGEVMLAFVNRFRAKDGIYRTFSWTAVSEGKRLFCVARDVTREVVRDEALRRYESIIQSDTAPICAFNSEYRQIAFNKAHSEDFFRTYGHRVRIGEVFPDLLLPEQASLIRGFIDRALAGELFTVTAEVGDPDLTVPHWELSYGPLRDEDGTVVGAFHHARDVSSRVQMHAELVKTQEVLRQAQKMEAIGQLTGGIAHDFNNLLGGMSAALQVLQARLKLGKFDGVERYTCMAQESIKRASALTQRLLAFARRQTLDSKPTDVNRLLSGLEDLIRGSVGPTVTVEVIGSGGLWATKVDVSQLENSVLNLCINARDAMLPAGGRLTIETANKWLDSRLAAEREVPPGQYVSISVTDTGSGMSQEVADRIFEPFFTTKPMGQGTGLGLSMVYGFVRQSGGQVRVYSELNKGTTMCLYLPRHHGEPEAGFTHDSSEFIKGGEGESIVLIEDEETIRIVVSEVLVEAGYSVATAQDGPSGLRILEKAGRVDCLITDVGLPGGLNGRQVADAARRIRPDLKVLFITGYAENAAVGDGHLERGMEVLTKPFDVGALVAKIGKMLY